MGDHPSTKRKSEQPKATIGGIAAWPARDPPWVIAMGHEAAFLHPRLSARYRLSQGTLAGMRGNGKDAP